MNLNQMDYQLREQSPNMAINPLPGPPNPELTKTAEDFEKLKARLQKDLYDNIASMRSDRMAKSDDDLVTILSGIGLPETMLTPIYKNPIQNNPLPRPPQKPYSMEETQLKLKEAQMEAENHSRADRLLRDRLIGIRGRFDLAQHEMMMVHVYHETVYIFYVFEGGKAGHLTDPIDLFPSDELVTQLRLLRNA